MDVIIAVAAHKKCAINLSKPYKFVIVGNGEVNIQNAWRDNTGDNISHKNANYCELTALYWIWKNKCTEYDAIGLCHYRRFFSRKQYGCGLKDILTESEILRILRNYDVILPSPFYWNKPVGKIYYENGEGKKKDLAVARKAVKKIFPEYLEDFDKVIERYHASYCNMFVVKQKRFCDYCNWLFAILGEVEKETNLTDYTESEARIFGYLSEILLNVWTEKNGLRVKYCPILYLEATRKHQLKMNFMTTKLGRRLSKISQQHET